MSETVRKYPDPILRRKSEIVSCFDVELGLLCDHLAETMVAAQGIGLTACQIGVSKRVCVLPSQSGDIMPMINPEITWASEEKDFGKESCLSLPRIVKPVRRPFEIAVKYFDREGKECAAQFKGIVARVVCHEIDHMDGILFVDRLVGGKESVRGALRRLAKGLKDSGTNRQPPRKKKQKKRKKKG